MADVFIMSYDISDDKIRNKVYKFLQGHGLSMQYSLFVVEAEEGTIRKISNKIKKLIDEGDRFSIYKVIDSKPSYIYGKFREEVKFEI